MSKHTHRRGPQDLTQLHEGPFQIVPTKIETRRGACSLLDNVKSRTEPSEVQPCLECLWLVRSYRPKEHNKEGTIEVPPKEKAPR